MASSRVLHGIVNGITGQTTVLLRIPDIPGSVAQIHAVIGQIQSFSASSAVTFALYHNTDLGVTLGVNSNLASQWCHLELPVDVDAAVVSPVVFPFSVPYELVGVQRWDAVPSAGTVTALISVVYTLRNEPNRTLWNEIRRRTSFERAS